MLSKGVLKLILKIKKSLSLIDYKLMISLIIIQLVPTLYTTLRVFFLGQLPGEYPFSIAGQLTWVNLLYEIINESIILPLYYFIGKASNNKNELDNCFKSGILVTFLLYVTKIWIPTLMGIALLFGIGMAFDSLVSLGAYRYLLKKNKIGIK